MSQSTSHFERIADEWRERAGELAQWTMVHLVNRTDVWGRYLPLQHRKNEPGQKNSAITAPFRDERGKVFLQVTSLEKHYRTRQPGGVLGLHSASGDGTSRWMAIDVDLHDEDELSVTPEGNFVAAHGWWEELVKLQLDPLLMDSNGKGGYHILVLFEKPMLSKTARAFLDQLVSDYERRGLDNPPDLFPGSLGGHHYGSWLRLPGRHHTRRHYHRVWNDEPWADETERWLEGHDAIERILRTRPATVERLEELGIARSKRTICLDFDGVIHAYRTGWQGETVIPDPPIHRAREAIQRLREDYRVVVHSARCRSDEGLQAVIDWLARHDIEVDEVCRFKPPAHVYVDDRAVPFRGDWDELVSDVRQFRK